MIFYRLADGQNAVAIVYSCLSPRALIKQVK